MDKNKLITWAWNNLEFYNCPESWEETYIIDILNGYNGTCHDVNGKVYSYSKIRAMFEEEV